MASSDSDTILLGYDGSPHARHAVAEAGRLFPGRRALVATAWRPLDEAAHAARAALSDHLIEEAVGRLDAEYEQQAAATAEEGAAIAREAGLDAQALAWRSDRAAWVGLLELVDERDVLAVVVGSRGRSAIAAALLGSVSLGLVHHSPRPVVVVRLER